MAFIRRHLVLMAGAASSLTLALCAQSVVAQSSAERNRAPDLLIRGGTIYPGGDDPFVGDILVTDDRITFVGPAAPTSAARVVDATGMIVAPGFIDPHTHADEALSSDLPVARLLLPFLTQGVTTAFIGVDGSGDPDTDEVLASGSGRDVGINFATYVGLGALRGQVIGSEDRAPTTAELQRMKQLTAQAMCSGALGLSSGLFYAPQSFASRDEVVALATEAGQRGGVYDTHMRDESSYTIGLEGAVEEALEIGRLARIPVHIGHIKALGVDVHGKAPTVIARIESALQAGQTVHADQYPWSASGTGLSSALLPRWAQDGGRKATLARFDEPETLSRIKGEMRENLRRRGGAASLLLTSGPPRTLGKTLEEIAAESGSDPIDAAIAVLREGEAGVASFNQSEDDIAAFMQQPWVVTSSDASGGHPRYYASFARKYDKYVKQDKVITLRQFIDQSTSRTADLFGFEDRGRLAPGAFADIVVFDPQRFAPTATYEQPTLFSQGVTTVLVNGELAISDGKPTGIAAGRPLRKSPPPSACE